MTGTGTPADSAVQKVFICYRREETAAHAGRLYDAMVARFGERNVFMDVDIAPGVDFIERITEVVSGCLVLIVVMGPNWATVEDEDGEPRIADPDDFVRLEVETGLRRPDVTPIPVLVAGARMPRREDLPPELAPIARRNALELSDARWGYDVGRLNATLDELLGETSAVGTPMPETSEVNAVVAAQSSNADPPAGPLLLKGMLLAGATAFVARGMGELIETPHDTAGEIANVMLRRGETWAFVGAALAIWLSLRAGRAGLMRPAITGLLVGAIAGAIGGAIWAVPFYLPDSGLTPETSDLYEVASLAVTGGFLGALIGAQWRPSRLGAGLLSGTLAGAVVRLFINAITGPRPSGLTIALSFALAGMAIAGLTLAVLLGLDRQRAAAKAATYAPAEP